MDTEFGDGIKPENESAKQKRRGGRHPKSKDELRINRIRSNATQDEYKRLQAYYTEQTLGKQISIGQFMIDCVLSSARRGRGGKRQTSSVVNRDALLSLRLDLNQLKNELGPIASNYNQSVKRINSLFVAAELKKEVSQANQTVGELTPLLAQLHALLGRLNATLVESN